jgi:hypothetical protein
VVGDRVRRLAPTVLVSLALVLALCAAGGVGPDHPSGAAGAAETVESIAVSARDGLVAGQAYQDRSAPRLSDVHQAGKTPPAAVTPADAPAAVAPGRWLSAPHTEWTVRTVTGGAPGIRAPPGRDTPA